MSTKNVVGQIDAATRRGVPVLAVSTVDPWALQAAILKAPEFAGAAVLAWDCVQGTRALNEAAGRLGQISSERDATEAVAGFRVLANKEAQKVAERLVILMHNAPTWLRDAGVVQAISNLRDPFKRSTRCLVMLGSQFRLPPELVQDVVVFEEELPDDAAIEAKVREVAASAQQHVGGKVTDAQVARIVDALRGLSLFAVEQVSALAVQADADEPIHVSTCWEQKRRQVGQTPGLSVTRGGLTFADLGGLDAVSSFFEQVANGKRRPKAVLFVDELDKALAGLGVGGGPGDSSGVTQDALGVLLREMEDNGWRGQLFVGPPGTAKTAVARAIGARLGIETVSMDLGAMKGSLVGESEAHIRDAMRVVKGISTNDVLVVATCNKLEALPPELRRRFTWGLWYFDIPTPEEAEVIWKLNLARYGLPADSKLPIHTGWTGAEIRNCCERAADFGIEVAEAARQIVPVTQSDPMSVAMLRRVADGHFLSASKPGVYRRPPDAEAPVEVDVPEGVARSFAIDKAKAS